MIEIEVWRTGEVVNDSGERRASFHAQIADRPSVWGEGASYSAAIGDLVDSHRKEFGISKVRFVKTSA